MYGTLLSICVLKPLADRFFDFGRAQPLVDPGVSCSNVCQVLEGWHHDSILFGSRPVGVVVAVGFGVAIVKLECLTQGPQHWLQDPMT